MRPPSSAQLELPLGQAEDQAALDYETKLQADIARQDPESSSMKTSTDNSMETPTESVHKIPSDNPHVLIALSEIPLTGVAQIAATVLSGKPGLTEREAVEKACLLLEHAMDFQDGYDAIGTQGIIDMGKGRFRDTEFDVDKIPSDDPFVLIALSEIPLTEVAQFAATVLNGKPGLTEAEAVEKAYLLLELSLRVNEKGVVTSRARHGFS